MTHDEMITVIQAHKKGKTIQYRDLDIKGSGWVDCMDNEPCWDFYSSEYRVKPDGPQPYENANEFIDEMHNHGSYFSIDGKETWLTPISITSFGVGYLCGLVPHMINYDKLKEVGVWMDGTVCGKL